MQQLVLVLTDLPVFSTWRKPGALSKLEYAALPHRSWQKWLPRIRVSGRFRVSGAQQRQRISNGVLFPSRQLHATNFSSRQSHGRIFFIFLIQSLSPPFVVLIFFWFVFRLLFSFSFFGFRIGENLKNTRVLLLLLVPRELGGAVV